MSKAPQMWQTRVPEIMHHVAQGWGAARLAKLYRITPAGMRYVLKQLNIRTKWQ